MWKVVAEGLWMTAAPSLDSPSIKEPSVYIQLSGSNCGVQGGGVGGGGRWSLGGQQAGLGAGEYPVRIKGSWGHDREQGKWW